MAKLLITIDGKTMSCEAWAKQDGVKATGAAIRQRIKRGMNHFDAVYGNKITHKNFTPDKSERSVDKILRADS